VRVIGLHHVSINVREVPRAMSSCREMMGFSVRSDRAAFNFDGAWLDAGSLQRHLPDQPFPGAVGQHFAVQVEDIDAAVAELLGVGSAKPV
jgi:glyoxylase I family protein